MEINDSIKVEDIDYTVVREDHPLKYSVQDNLKGVVSSIIEKKYRLSSTLKSRMNAIVEKNYKEYIGAVSDRKIPSFDPVELNAKNAKDVNELLHQHDYDMWELNEVLKHIDAIIKLRKRDKV